MEVVAKKAIIRIEIWHGILVLVLLAVLGPTKIVDPIAVLLGGVFMGVNFLLLGFGVAWILTPIAGKRRFKAGLGLLVGKVLLFLGLLTTMFYKFELDAVSFALGFSMLLVAILMEAVRRAVRVGDD